MVSSSWWRQKTTLKWSGSAQLKPVPCTSSTRSLLKSRANQTSSVMLKRLMSIFGKQYSASGLTADTRDLVEPLIDNAALLKGVPGLNQYSGIRRVRSG